VQVDIREDWAFPLVASSSLEAGSDESSTVVLVILCGIGQQASTLVGPADGGSITATWVQAIQSSPYTSLSDQLVVCSVQTSLAFLHHAVVPSGLSAEGEVLF
jgi:hypothetical protein